PVRPPPPPGAQAAHGRLDQPTLTGGPHTDRLTESVSPALTPSAGATAVQIMHKRGRRVLGIDHIGSARTDAELALLEAIAHERLHAGQGQLPLEPGGPSAATAATTGMQATVAGTSSLVLWEALERVYGLFPMRWGHRL